MVQIVFFRAHTRNDTRFSAHGEFYEIGINDAAVFRIGVVEVFHAARRITPDSRHIFKTHSR